MAVQVISSESFGGDCLCVCAYIQACLCCRIAGIRKDYQPCRGMVRPIKSLPLKMGMCCKLVCSSVHMPTYLGTFVGHL